MLLVDALGLLIALVAGSASTPHLLLMAVGFIVAPLLMLWRGQQRTPIAVAAGQHDCPHTRRLRPVDPNALLVA
jgi:hypothetical protein